MTEVMVGRASMKSNRVYLVEEQELGVDTLVGVYPTFDQARVEADRRSAIHVKDDDYIIAVNVIEYNMDTQKSGNLYRVTCEPEHSVLRASMRAQ